MKAGKSTSINAIVGQEILPNRALPMTVFPNLVTHTPGQIEPVLYFKHIQPLIALANTLIDLLNDEMNRSGIYDIDRLEFWMSDTSKTLIHRMVNNGWFLFEGEYRGQKAIFEFLQELNDLMRMAKEFEVEPPYAEYQSVESLPRIEVEFYHLKHSSESYGRLSILDTPGPNEFGQSDALKKVFQMQLRQASAVLLVMDYTQLNADYDGMLREEVYSIKKDLGERLFVLVNKFDNANKNTMNKEQTRHYVATKLLSKFPKEKVFLVSSWFGYLANRALSELEKGRKINPVDDWVEDFGLETFGVGWEDYIDTPGDVKGVSKALWKCSNLQDPLDKVIKEAHIKALFLTFSSALDKIPDIALALPPLLEHLIASLERDVDGFELSIRHGEDAYIFMEQLDVNTNNDNIQFIKDLIINELEIDYFNSKEKELIIDKLYGLLPKLRQHCEDVDDQKKVLEKIKKENQEIAFGVIENSVFA